MNISLLLQMAADTWPDRIGLVCDGRRWSYGALLRAASEGPLGHILGYEERPLVSVDYKDDPRSSIVDALSTMVVGGTQVKILAWYDNEWGYANRWAELARLVGARLQD